MTDANGDLRDLVADVLRPDAEPMWPEPTEAEVEAARTHANGEDIYFLRYGRDVFIVRAPTQGDVRRFMDMGTEPQRRGMATELLGRSCVLFPDAQTVATWLRKWPMLGTKLGNDVAGLGRSNEEAVIKKA